MPFVGASALARLDAALVERIRRGDRLGAILASSIAAIVIGAGGYGIAFGIWRAPEQALYGAIKLPLLFLATSACTIALSGMLAMLLRARLSLAQTAVCIAPRRIEVIASESAMHTAVCASERRARSSIASIPESAMVHAEVARKSRGSLIAP